jgi:transglutaminase-like putative cysteine protease
MATFIPPWYLTSINHLLQCVMKSRALSVLIPVLSALLLASCGGTSAWLNDDELARTLRETLPIAGRYADAGAVILLDEGSMDISGGTELGVSMFERHRIIRITSPRGQRFANVIVPYGSSTHVDLIEARTITPDGRTVPLLEKDIFDVSLYPNFVFFSDQRAKIFTMPALDNGAVVEYTYRLTIRGREFWPSWAFQEDAPVAISRFTLVKPGEWDLVYRSYGTPVEPTTTRVPAGFRSTHRWEAHDIPPLRFEFGMPPASELASSIAIAPVGFKTWNDIARWYGEIVGSRNHGGAALGALADSLTHDVHTDREKLKRIFEWTRDRVRYIAVEVGTGGYQPHHADEVFAKRYGDCKDVVMLLSALAGALNIEVRPVLISTWQNGRPDTMLPSAFQFNHLIAYAPAISPGGIWLDATDKAATFGSLPWYDRATDVIIAGSDTTRCRVVTPGDQASSNSTDVAWHVALAANGSATITGTHLFTGAFALEMRNELGHADSADIRHWLGTSLAHRCQGATLISYDVPPISPPQDSFTVSYRFSAPAFAVARDSVLIIRPWSMNASTLSDQFREEQRTHPVRFRYPSRSALNLTINPPRGWRVITGNGNDSLVAPFGSAQWSIVDRGDSASMSMQMEITGRDLAPGEYPAFRRFLDAVRLREVREVQCSPPR